MDEQAVYERIMTMMDQMVMAGTRPDDALYRSMGVAIGHRHAGQNLTRSIASDIVHDLISGDWKEGIGL